MLLGFLRQPSLRALSGEMALQEPQVAAIGLEGEIEPVAHNRNGADGRVEAHVRRHARKQPARRARPAGLRHQPDGQRQAGGIANDGNEPQQAVQPDPPRREGNPPAVVQQPGQTLKLFYRRAMIQMACTRPGT
jgi:hypothetical protein